MDGSEHPAASNSGAACPVRCTFSLPITFFVLSALRERKRVKITSTVNDFPFWHFFAQTFFPRGSYWKQINIRSMKKTQQLTWIPCLFQSKTSKVMICEISPLTPLPSQKGHCWLSLQEFWDTQGTNACAVDYTWHWKHDLRVALFMEDNGST